MISQIFFFLIAFAAIGLFTFNMKKIIRNIRLGKSADRTDQPKKRLMLMLRVAFGQSKMSIHPIPAVLHLIVYIGFIVVNIELLEILLDGLWGTHRIFFQLSLYNVLIASFELFAFAVWLSCLVFLIRRTIINLRRFRGVEMTTWPRSDANSILIMEILLMTAFIFMNGADVKLQTLGSKYYVPAGSFPISGFLMNILPASEEALILLERSCWWFHILGIFIFLNYLPYSKHIHIFFAFPNTYFSKLDPVGTMANMPVITTEVKIMMDSPVIPGPIDPGKFGARDVLDLSWINLMNAYTCTECGRCTSVCPANLTGKLLSPRKIMMVTRDRIAEVGANLDKHGPDFDDRKSLLDDYISPEEIWACTSCSACVQECPVNIDPLSIIMELRRYTVMEESKAPASLNVMLNNIENNQAPWKYAAADRFNWAKKD